MSPQKVKAGEKKSTAAEKSKSKEKEPAKKQTASAEKPAPVKSDAPAPDSLGKKYECYGCGVKFYDLCKPEPICPRCGSNQKNAPPKPALGKAAVAAAKKKRKAVKAAEPDEIMDVLPMDDDVYLEDEFGTDFEAAEPEEDEEEF